MSDLRLGGLISGMDTQDIISQLMEAARKPLIELENDRGLLSLKKSTFVNFEKQITTFQKSLLNMRLETTFKSKIVTSSNSSYLTGSADIESEPGSHVVNISQVAQSAVARSHYTRAVLTTTPSNTAGIDSISGRPDDNLAGRHEISITDEGTYYRARSEFYRFGGGAMQTLTGTAVESAAVEGTIASDINSGAGNNQLTVTLGEESVTVTLDDATADATSMSRIAADMENKLNDALNTALDTDGVSYLAVRTSRDGTAATDTFAIYNVSGNEDIIVTDDATAAALGFGGGGTAGTANSITTDVTANSLNELLVEINEPLTGLIRGVSFEADETSGLTVGKAEIHTNASLNARGPSKSLVTGGDSVSLSGTLDTTVTGLENAGFENEPSTTTNGTFSINDVQITIDDYTELSVDDVLAIINSSGAGVTATYDVTNDQFVLESNENSSSLIDLGSPTDTSDFLTVAKLTSNENASFTAGSTSTSISTSSTLASAGFTVTPTSGTFTINGTTLFVDASTDTMNDLIEKINNSGAQVKASYDSKLDTFTLTSKMGDVDSNLNKITLGNKDDTSNILAALNLEQFDYPETTSSIAPAGDRANDTITVTPYGSGSGVDISVEATVGAGAYQAEPGIVNWGDGIADGENFTVFAGNDGSSGFLWTNNTGQDITNIDDFVAAWNNATNWTGTSRVEVGVIKESDDQLRFFSRAQDASGGSADFTIESPTAGDLFELGLSTSQASLSENITNGMAAAATEQTNAMNLAFSVNSSSSAGIKATTDGSGAITFTSLTSGQGGEFTLSDEATEATNTIQDFFGASSVTAVLPGNGEVGYRGQDATFTVDGVSYTRSTNSVDDVVGGVTLNLHAPTETPVTLTIENDSEKALKTITEFIVSYNEIIATLNPPRIDNEQKSYLEPLSDDKRYSMTYTEIEEYEEYHQVYGGWDFIRREGSMKTLSSSIRQITSGEVQGSSSDLNMLSMLGITAGSVGGFEDARDGYLLFAPTGESSYSDEIRNYLELNSSLMDALENGADKVFDLFGREGDDGEDDGLARQLDALMEDYIESGGILDRLITTGGTIDDEIETLDDRIDRLEKRLDSEEERYWSQFTRMEQELARLSESSSALSSLLSSVQG